MATKAKQKKDPKVSSPGERAIHFGLGIAGGAIGNKITTFLESQSWLGPAAPYASSITGLIGGAIYVFVPPTTPVMRSLGAFGLGMGITGGTEQAEGLMGIMQGALGMTDKQLGLGRSHLGMDPSKSGQEDRPFYVNGTAIN
jgi:hypothetical protein